MKYFEQLTYDEILDLVNTCIKEKNTLEDWRIFDLADRVEILMESDRVNNQNERYACVKAYNTRGGVPIKITTYNFYDFDVEAITFQRGILTNAMRKFMAKRFGEDYINDLYSIKLAEAKAEYESLMSFLEESRKAS